MIPTLPPLKPLQPLWASLTPLPALPVLPPMLPLPLPLALPLQQTTSADWKTNRPASPPVLLNASAPPTVTPLAAWPPFSASPYHAANLPLAGFSPQNPGARPVLIGSAGAPSSGGTTGTVQIGMPLSGPRPLSWKNDLKDLFHKNQAVIYALNIRTFGAEDKNNDGRISVSQGENGTFLSSINKLDQLVNLGVNTIHLLPINPIGQNRRLGAGGSLYSPSDYLRLNPEFDVPGNGSDVMQEARQFMEACHQRGIRVMVDVPSCASSDLSQARPDLIAKDKNGKTMTPTNWVDIVMFKNDQKLQDYYEGFFDLMANKVGVDGFRVDVARARTLDFWRHFTGKYPDKAWLAESYCQEDQSPLKNLPRDIPEDLLRAGFDSYYGQFHIFHSMANAKEYMDYLLSNRAMFQRASQNGGSDKSLIGSFLTHDDPSLMEHGGASMCMLTSGLMVTQPYTNPYILDGFTTGYTGDFDIFNFVPQHKGNHPEIGLFLRQMLNLRQAYGPVLTQGAFIPIPVNGGPNNQVIAFARQAQGKTLLVVANKDINAAQKATLAIPGFSPTQPLTNLAPGYGRPSYFYPGINQMNVDLGPGRFHVFEITTPNLAKQLPSY